MTSANCPACGAPIAFRYAQAVQTVCEYCRSVLVRHDVNLERVGQTADVPDNASPIQIGTEGVYRGKGFQVVGRIVYEYELGAWNEWHLVFNDSSSGWLSDAQLEYAVTFLTPASGPLPEDAGVSRGQVFNFDGTPFYVTTITQARYRGVEGELPFVYWDKAEVGFIDLRSNNARFGTIDFTEKPPLLFLGEAVEFDDLRLTNLREFEGWSR
jgi:hypothetical protein